MDIKELVEALFDPKKNFYEAMVAKMSKPFNLKNIIEIDHLLIRVNGVLNKCDLKNATIAELNQISEVPLRLDSKLVGVNGFGFRKKVISYFKPISDRFAETCQTAEIQVFNGETQYIAKKSDKEIPKVFLDYFERIQAKDLSGRHFSVKWTLWNAVSVSLFGDCRATEALRLSTLAILNDFEKEFRAFLEDQKEKFEFQLEFKFENLFDLHAANNEEVLLDDEIYIFALSVALRRPIYLYSDFSPFGTSFLAPTVPDLYHAAQEFYENSYKFGHYRFVGFEVDEGKEPICLYFAGNYGYTAVLAKYKNVPVKTWKPKTLFFDYLVPRTADSSIKSDSELIQDFDFEKESDTESIMTLKTDSEFDESFGDLRLN